jgi:hypothetical protein
MQLRHVLRQLPVLALPQQLLAAQLKQAQHGAHTSQQPALEGHQRPGDALNLRLVQQLKPRPTVKDPARCSR